MIIWKGRGILIPLFAIGGFVLGMMTSSIFPKGSDAPMVIGIWLASAMVWFFALSGLGKATKTTLIDPKTMQPVVFENSHTLYFMPPMVWAVLSTCFALFLSVPIIVNEDDKDVAPAGGAGEQAFQLADRSVSSLQSPKNPSGNTAVAKAIAAEISQLSKFLRSKGISQNESQQLKDFNAHVHLTESRCIVLLQVPDLRKFTDGAKDTMVEMAWVSAQMVVGEAAPHIETLVVGVRGSLLYERVLKGSLAGIDSENPRQGVEKEVASSQAREFLELEFEAAAGDAPAAARVAAAAPETDTQKVQKTTESSQAEVASEAKPATPEATPQSDSPPVPDAYAGTAAENPSSAADLRDWKDAAGRPLRAALVRFTDEARSIGEFKREDGQLFTIPVEKFSAEDQAFLAPLLGK